MSGQAWLWIFFNLFVVGMLVLDLGVFHRTSHHVKLKEAMIWSAIWITLALAFMGLIHYWKGPQSSLEFFTGYILEKSLSVDNLFVFLLIFSYFRVSPHHQHKVLFWGILGALIMRAFFIAVGVTLLHRFHWLFFIFGGFLVVTGIKMAFERDKEIHPERNFLLQLVRKVVPVTRDYEGDHFFVRRETKLYATPLFIVLLVVETTDLIFAVDSIPAVLAVTVDPFIVYSSNVFAILGLRALYFALSGVMQLFHHLHYGLAAILAFVGVKMIIQDWYPIPLGIALSLIAMILALSIAASIRWPKKEE